VFDRQLGQGPHRLSARDLVDPVVQLYYPALLDSVHACLAVVGSMALAKRTKPLSLILETPSGFGKSAVLQMCFPSKGSPLEKHIYRSDKFTPKAFVSQAANIPVDRLEQVDLLPRLENKVLITKELAPLFRGRQEEMQENFSMLISVLDGKGFTSDAGIHGQRGYQRDILFNWLGATTPFPPSVHNIFAQLGTRLLFYVVPAIPPTEDELVAYALADDANPAEVDCQRAVGAFLIEFFHTSPVGSINPDSIEMTDEQAREIVRWARFLVAARAEIKSEKENTNWVPVGAGPAEGPWKVISYFKDLARGHSLICGRSWLDASDLALVAHVALSSIPGHLRPLIRALRRGSITTPQAEELCRVTSPTARNYLKQLALLGIAELGKHTGRLNQPETLTLASAYNWLKTTIEI